MSPDNSSARPVFRMTRQREVILKQLNRPGIHLSADEVYEGVRKEIPNISLGTVYRNLELLSGAGKIRKLNIDGERSYYDGGLHAHYHVRCIECGRVSDVSAQQVGDLCRQVEVDGFEIFGYELVFHGVCRDCRANR